MTKEQTPPLVSDEQMVGYREGMSPGERLHATDLSAFAVRSIYEADRQKTLEVVQALVDALTRQRNAMAAVNYYRKNKNNPHADKPLNSDIQMMWREFQESNNAAAIVLSKLNIEPTKP